MILSSINKIKNFNQSLQDSLSKRTNLYFNLITENEELKKNIHLLKNKGIFDLLNKEQDIIYNNKMEDIKITDRSIKSFSYKTKQYNKKSSI